MISKIKESLLSDEKLVKELRRFLLSGGSAVLTDYGTYFLLRNYMPNDLAKAISFILGTVVAYLLNKFYTFEQRQKSGAEVVKFILLYSFTLGANILVNKAVLSIFPDFVFFAFLAATGTSTVLNFIGQKWWVFK